MPLLPLLLLLAQAQPTFRSDVALVHVDVEVREDGHPAADLGKESFRVTDEGRLQRIVYFGHDEEPLDVVLLFDARGHIGWDVKRITAAAHTALSELREGDHVAIMAFGAAGSNPRAAGRNCRTDLVLDFTGDFDEAERSVGNQVLQQEVNSNYSWLCSGLISLADAAQHFQGQPMSQPNGNRKRAIIIVTDDKGSGMRAELVRDAIHNLWKADAVVLGVLVHSGEIAYSIPPYRGARYAAEQTGGDVLKTEDAADGLREMMRRLRTRYSLYYALPPGKPGEERKLRVQLTTGAAKCYPRAVIRARTGYVVPGSR
jgi:VWFA-related protein